MADDEKDGSGSSPETDDKKNDDESLETSEADTETSEGEESEGEGQSSSKAQKRIQQLLQQRKEAQGVVAWYRENIGDPSDVQEFKKWKEAQLKKAEAAEEEGDITPAKLKKIKELMRKADPEYAEYIEREKERTKNAQEAQFDEAEEEIRVLAQGIGIPAKNEAAIGRLAKQVMLEIKDDKKLLQRWQAGHTLSVVRKAFAQVEKELVGVLRKSTPTPTPSQQAADKRKISRLPTLPTAGSGSVSTKAARKPEDKGITKNTQDEAWAVFQSHMTD